jgi:autotransporter-associated beta strand protein
MKTPTPPTTSILGRLAQIKTLALSAGLMASAAAAFGQTLWTGGPSDYNNPASWNGAYNTGNPNCSNDNGSNNVVLIQPGDPLWQHGDTLAGNGNNTSGAYLQTGSTNNTGGGNWLRMGIGSGSYGYYVFSNGVVNVGGRTQIGENGTGYLEIDGGIYNGNVNDGGANPAMVCGQGDFGPGTGTLVVNGGIVNMARETWIGESIGTGSFFMNGGTYNANDWFAIGRAGAPGTLTMTNGTINKTGNGEFLIGTGGNGFMNQTGGVLNSTSRLRIGDGSTGVYNLAGGSASVGSEFWIGQSGTGNGTLNLSGTAALTNSSWLAVGREGAHGVLNISGGTMVVNIADGGANISICHGSGAQGTVNQSGGTFMCVIGQTWIGEDSGTGTWNMTGGLSIHNDVHIAQNSSASGILNLAGGTFQANSISSPSPTAATVIQFNGGTLQARANNSSFLSGVTYALIDSGNAIIDSQSYNITIPQTLTDDNVFLSQTGGLTKKGTGTLTLTGANTYTGNTTISGGSLFTTTATAPAGAPGNLTLADGSAFGLAVLSAGANFGAANLTLGTSGATTLNFDIGGFGNPGNSQAPVILSGNLINHAVTTVNIADATPQVGQFPLIQYPSGTLSGGGSFVLGSVPVGVTASIVTNSVNHSIDLNIAQVNQPRWDGQAGATWDTSSDTNWVNIGTGLPTTYTDPSLAVFNDQAVGSTTVNLTTTVHPLGVNVTNNTLNYTIVGSGSISGSTGLTKGGSATLSILNNNGYTGPTVISGGVLNVTNLANGGSPSPLGASSANPTNLVIDSGTLQFSGAPVAANRGFTLNAVGATIDTEANATLGGPVAVGSSASFVKVGPAQLSLTATGSNQLGNVNPGTQVEQGTLKLDGSAGSQINHDAQDFYVGCTTVSGGAVILTNTTLNVDAWLAVGRINGGINNTSSLTLYNSAVTCGNLSLGWDGGLPNNLSSQFVTLNGSSTLTNYGVVNLPEGANSSMTFTVNGSSEFWVQNPFYICLANNTTGSVVVANSGKIVQANGWFDIGQGNNCVASVLVKNNATLSLDGDCNLADTAGGANGTLTVQDNGTLTANNLFVGKSSSSVCTVNFAGSATGTFGNFMRLADGSSSIGNVNISGGSLTFGQYMNMAGGSGSTASVTMSGGSLTGGNDMTVGDQATATVTMNGGVLTVPNTVYLSRGNGVANGTVNLNAGGTIVCGNINNGWAFNEATNSPTFNPNAFNFNGGILKSYGSYSYIFPNVNAVVQAGGAIIDDNGYTVEFGGALVNGGGGGGLTKRGSGTLRFDGTNTYTGTTLVSAGTLCGFGTIAGPVNVAAGATLLPGTTTTLGTLTINNSLTLSNSATTMVKITLDGGATNDAVTGLTGVTYGGSLVVTNIGVSSLVVGASFQLFNTSSHAGNFSSVTVQPSGAGTFNPTTGILTITSAGGGLTFSPVKIASGNLILTGMGGTPSAGYTLLTTTNLTTPSAAWTTNTTGNFDGSGSFSNSIPVSPITPARFFRIRTP